jgi:WD40 repeat protein
VFQVPALPVDRYQLVHDYLVAFVRQQQSARLIAELEKEREQRKLSEARLNQVLKQQLRAARRATITLAGLLVTIGGVALIATVAGLNLYLTNLSTSSAQNKQLDRVVSALKAAKQFKQLWIATIPIPGTKLKVLAELNQAVSSVAETNRLEENTSAVTQISFSPNSQIIATVSEDKTASLWRRDGNLIASLKGHNDTVTSTSFSSDNKMLATASKDDTVQLFRSSNGGKITFWKADQGGITNVSFSPNGKMLATAGENNTVKFWTLDGKKIKTLKPIKLSERVKIMSFSPDGKTLATSSQFDTVKLWKVDDGNKIREIDNYGAMNMRFSPDGKNITLVNKDGTIKLWSIKNVLLKNTNPCVNITFNAVSLSPDENLLAYNLTDSSLYKNTIFLGSPTPRGCYDFYFLNVLNHNDSIASLSFSPDGKWLASASKDKTVKLWRVDKAKSLYLPEDGKNRITRVKYSRDGKTIAIGRNDNTVEIRQDGTQSKILPADSSILSFSPDGKTLATGSTEDIVTLWSPNDKEIRLKEPLDNIKSLNVSPDGQLIVVASRDKKVQLWHRNGTLFKNLSVPIDSVKSVKFSPDSQMIAAIGDNKVVLWGRDGSPMPPLQGHTKEVTDVVFNKNSKFIASYGDDNVVNLWRRDGKRIKTKTLTGHTDRVTSVSFSHDSSIIASVSNGGGRPENSEIRLWRSKDGTPLRDPIENYGIKSVSFSHDSRTIASINADNTVKLWSLQGKSPITLKGHNAPINSLSFSLDGKMIATASDDGTVGLWTSSNAYKFQSLRGHEDAVYSVSFSRDSKTIASASKDKTVRLWKIGNNTPFKTLSVPSDGGNSDSLNAHWVSFSADGKFITSVSGFRNWSGGRYKSNYTVNIWRGDGDEKSLKTLSGQGDYYSVKSDAVDNWLDAFKKVSFSANGRTFALASRDHAINLWNLDSNKKLTLKGHNNWVNSVSFSSDGKLIASGSDDGTIKLWRSTDGKFLKPIGQHNDKVNSVSFSPDGKMIASASDDKTVKLWNSNGTPYKPFPSIDGHNERVTSVRFSPDGKTIAYASESDTVRLRSISDGKDEKELQKPDNSNSISEIDALNFSEDDNRLALGGNGMSSTQLYIPNGFWFKATQLYNTIGSSDVSFKPSNDSITVTSNDGKLLLSPSLDELLVQGCTWARDYLKNPSAKVDKSDRTLCDDIPTQN